MNIKIKKLHPDAVIPSYAKNGDAGMDLTAISSTLQNDKFTGYIEYNTGLSIEIPEGFVGLIFPRSSISKTSHILANSVGVIDSGYRGEITVRMKIDSNPLFVDNILTRESLSEEEKYFYEAYVTKLYNVGDKIAQLIILPYPNITFDEVTELSETERGEGGYGSTDKNKNNE